MPRWKTLGWPHLINSCPDIFVRNKFSILWSRSMFSVCNVLSEKIGRCDHPYQHLRASGGSNDPDLKLGPTGSIRRSSDLLWGLMMASDWRKIVRHNEEYNTSKESMYTQQKHSIHSIHIYIYTYRRRCLQFTLPLYPVIPPTARTCPNEGFWLNFWFLGSKADFLK